MSKAILTWLEPFVAKEQLHRDWRDVGGILGDGDHAEHGVDGNGAGKQEKALQGSNDAHEPHRVDGRSGPPIDLLEEPAEWEGAISRIGVNDARCSGVAAVKSPVISSACRCGISPWTRTRMNTQALVSMCIPDGDKILSHNDDGEHA